MRAGIRARHPHDCVRHGTTTLFAALNVPEATAIGPFPPRQRHIGFLAFLERIEPSTSRRRDVHMNLDNYGAHIRPKVRAWFTGYPRYHLRFTPSDSSSLNLLERWFAEITRKCIRRGTSRSVAELTQVIYHRLRANNQGPRPFIWTAKAPNILTKIKHCKEALHAAHQ